MWSNIRTNNTQLHCTGSVGNDGSDGSDGNDGNDEHGVVIFIHGEYISFHYYYYCDYFGLVCSWSVSLSLHSAHSLQIRIYPYESPLRLPTHTHTLLRRSTRHTGTAIALAAMATAATAATTTTTKNMIYCQVLGKYHISYVCIHVKGI